MTGEDIIRLLDLKPHPEGGHFRETFRDGAGNGGRAAVTAIYFLLRNGEVSGWHRIDATEIWHWYAGDPLELKVSDGSGSWTCVLGPGLGEGQSPQAVVPKHHWQSARSLGAYSLVGCTVSPGFEFSGFELAPDAWEPG
jgi:hypothetical protein